jgi:hypothetical protein
MENPSFQNLAVAFRSPRADGVPRRYGALAYLRSGKGLLLVAAALGIIAFFAGWQWFGTAAMLPLLYVLPCAAMVAMCMNGHGGAGNTQGKLGASSGTEPDGSP